LINNLAVFCLIILPFNCLILNTKKKKIDWKIVVLILGVFGVLAANMQNRQSEKEDEEYRTNADIKRDSIDNEVSKDKEMIEKLARNSDAEKYFRENNFSILNDKFPNGYMITRQLKSGGGF